MLVGPAGVGKTVASGEAAHPMLSTLEDHYLGATNVTRASLIDDLYQAERGIVRPGGILSFNALTVVSNELGVLIPAYEPEFMNALTDLYDGRVYEEKKRTAKLHIRMDRPTLNLLAATTPSYLNGLLPEGAWDQGFLSRTIMIYSGDTSITDLWSNVGRDVALQKNLIADLHAIGDMMGEMSVLDEVKQAFMQWVKGGAEPRPDHPKLTTYATRRPAHLLKLMMIASASRGNDFVITLEDYTTALDWLIEAETYMPDIFKAMTSGGNNRIIEETWYFAYTLYVKEKKPISENRIVMFLQERAPAHSIAPILEVMVKAGILKEEFVPKAGKAYTPRGRKPT